MTVIVVSKFDKEFGPIQSLLVQLGEMVDVAISHAMDALVNRDVSLAKSVLRDDMNINAIRYQVEEGCLYILATNQPTAGGLKGCDCRDVYRGRDGTHRRSRCRHR